jgi:hypothetical protein
MPKDIRLLMASTRERMAAVLVELGLLLHRDRLLNHLIGAQQYQWGYGKAERPPLGSDRQRIGAVGR